MGISIGMVGLGMFGSGFVDLFKAHPLVDRIAFCDLETDRVKKWADDPFMARKVNKKDVYSSLDEICKSDLDALVIITQPWLHAPQCIKAMQTGKHVFSAVPIISVPDDDEILDWCDKVIATVKSTGKHYMLGETSYYHPEVMFMRRKRAEGAFGRFVSAESEYTHDYSGAWVAVCALFKRTVLMVLPGGNGRRSRRNTRALRAGRCIIPRIPYPGRSQS